MQEWTVVAQAALQAEFPSWHTLACFNVFRLSGTTSQRKEREPEVESSLEKLAKTFGVNFGQLKQEFCSLLPVAMALQKQSGFDNRSAWQAAVLKVDGRASLRRKYESQALQKVRVGAEIGRLRLPYYVHFNELIHHFFWEVKL